MPEKSKPPIINVIQSYLLWIGVGCFCFKLYLKTDDAKDQFGNIIQLVKQTNAIAMGLCAVLSGKKLVDLLIKIKKMPENIEEL